MTHIPSIDPFASDFEETAAGSDGLIHIRVQNRRGRKKVTTITGLSHKVDFKAVLQRITKQYKCGGSIVEDEEFGKVIRVQGDFRDQLRDFLINNQMVRLSQIKIHIG